MTDVLSRISTELVVAISTFVLGYLAHQRSVAESKASLKNAHEDKKMFFYELELKNLNDKQLNIQTQLEKTIARLERERVYLAERIDALEKEIEEMRDEVYLWREKYYGCINSK